MKKFGQYRGIIPPFESVLSHPELVELAQNFSLSEAELLAQAEFLGFGEGPAVVCLGLRRRLSENLNSLAGFQQQYRMYQIDKHWSYALDVIELFERLSGMEWVVIGDLMGRSLSCYLREEKPDGIKLVVQAKNPQATRIELKYMHRPHEEDDTTRYCSHDLVCRFYSSGSASPQINRAVIEQSPRERNQPCSLEERRDLLASFLIRAFGTVAYDRSFSRDTLTYALLQYLFWGEGVGQLPRLVHKAVTDLVEIVKAGKAQEVRQALTPVRDHELRRGVPERFLEIWDIQTELAISEAVRWHTYYDRSLTPLQKVRLRLINPDAVYIVPGPLVERRPTVLMFSDDVGLTDVERVVENLEEAKLYGAVVLLISNLPNVSYILGTRQVGCFILEDNGHYSSKARLLQEAQKAGNGIWIFQYGTWEGCANLDDFPQFLQRYAVRF